MRNEIMDGQAIMVVPGDWQWTQQAMHLACAMARDTGTAVVAVRMVPVNHPLLLGDISAVKHTADERSLPYDCAVTAEDYGVAYQMLVFNYVNYFSGLSSAAEQINAIAIFMSIHHSSFVPWDRFQLWRLRRAAKRIIYTLETPADQPAVNLGGNLPGLGDAGIPAIASSS
jgi:hypothetical protein